MSTQSLILENLRKGGHRVTPQQVMILEVMGKHHGHISAEEVYLAINQAHPYVNRATAYRTLDMLTKAGVLTVTDLGTGPVSYEMYRGEPHHHLVCQNCGKIEEFDHALLEALQASLAGSKP
jgi:Fur family ferric uptake transcriptional regulator